MTPGVPQDAQQAELLAVLRQQEQGDGLATAQCFLESRGLGSVPERVELCAGVASVAAAHCYRRAAAVRVRWLLPALIPTPSPYAHPAPLVSLVPPYFLIPSPSLRFTAPPCLTLTACCCA